MSEEDSDGVPKLIVQFVKDNLPLLRKIAPAWLMMLLNGGIGFYWLATALLAVALALLSNAVVQPWFHGRTALMHMLNSRQEPFRGDQFPALTAALLDGPEAPWTACSSSETGRVLDQAHKLFEAGYFRDSNAATLDVKQFPALETALDGADLASSVPATIKLKKDCPEDQVDCPASETKGVGSAWTDGSRISKLRIPSLVAAGVSTPEQFPKSIQEAARRSIAIEALTGLLGRSAVGVGDTARPDFKAFFFISNSGLLRIVPPFPFPVPAHRLFNASSYSARAFARDLKTCNGSPSVQSLPYLDYTGKGVVQTICYPVSRSEENGREVTEGIFCADVGMPRDLLRNHLAYNRSLFDIFLVEVSRDGGGKNPLIEECGQGQDSGPRCPPEVIPKSAADKDLARKGGMAWWNKISNDGGVNGASERVDVDGNGNALAFSVWQPAGDTPSQFEVAVVRLRQFHSYWRLIGAMICFLLSVGVTLASRFRQDSRKRAAFIRGLPYGIVQSDASEFVIAANDRAEQIFGVKLPKIGIEADLIAFGHQIVSPVPVVELIDPNHIYVRATKKQATDPGAFQWRGRIYVPQRFEEIRDRRKSGISSKYWARLRACGGWVAVQGAPLIDTSTPDQSTFALVELVRDAEFMAQLTDFSSRSRSSDQGAPS